MGKQNFLAAVAGQAELLHDLGLLGFGYTAAVEVGALTVGVALELLEATLIIGPLIGQELAAVHTTHRDDHLAIRGGGFTTPVNFAGVTR